MSQLPLAVDFQYSMISIRIYFLACSSFIGFIADPYFAQTVGMHFFFILIYQGTVVCTKVNLKA